MRKSGSQRQREVLQVLRANQRPMTAYEILGQIADAGSLAPPTIYRALSALVEKGSAHRLESINAFVSCTSEHSEHAPVLAICDDCGSVEEHVNRSAISKLSTITQKTGFRARHHVVEVHGLCQQCAS